jgi:hypothetical protein
MDTTGGVEMSLRSVYIIRRGEKAIVWPPYVNAHEGDYITFKTLGVSAKIEFPFDEPFEADSSPTHYNPTPDKPSWIGVENAQGGLEAIVRVGVGKQVRVKLKDEGKSEALKKLRVDRVMGEAGENMAHGNVQVYSYSVFCPEINDFAEGNSSPVIMIEPPEKPGP